MAGRKAQVASDWVTVGADEWQTVDDWQTVDEVPKSTPGSLRPGLDPFKGFAQGVGKSALDLYGIVQRNPGVLFPPLIPAGEVGLLPTLPEPPASWMEAVKPKTPGEQIGYYAETAAELAPLVGTLATKVGSKLAPVVGRVAAGAKEGGLGGAVARGLRAVAPQEARATMFQALKPRLSKVNFERSLDQALPELKAAEAKLGKPIENLAELTEGLKEAKANLWSQLETVMGPARTTGKMVDLTPVADEITGTITKTMRLENPAKVKAIEKLAGKYRGKFSLQDAEEFLHNTNAEAAPFYSKLPAEQQRAIQSGANLSQLEAKAAALRKAIDRSLDDLIQGSGAAAKELRRRYGSLMEVNEEAVRRVNIAKRQQPESLSEQMAGWSAAGDIAKGSFRMVRGIASGSPGTFAEGAADIVSGQAKRSASKFIKEQQTTDALIRRAMQDVSRMPTPVDIPPPPRIAGLLEPGATRMPGVADPSGITVTTGPPLRPNIKGLLEPPPTRMPPGPDQSGVRATSPREIMVRDPKTGKIRRVFMSDWKGRGMAPPPQ